MTTEGTTTDRRLGQAQGIVLSTLFGGYVGYYFCRSHLSVASPLILDSFAGEGVSKGELGLVVSAGTAFYALGKLVTGPLADRFGGRRLFLAGMTLSVLATALAASLGVAADLTSVVAGVAFAVFGGLWALNRLAQSIGWVALVRVVGRWFPVGRHATVMGILSLSFLLGDAFVRLCLGGLMRFGEVSGSAAPIHFLATWPAIFAVAAGVLAIAGLIAAKFLRESPADVGLPEPAANPINVYEREQSNAPSMPDVWMLWRPLLASPLFWLVSGMSFGLTLIRETVNFWTPTYLKEVAGLEAGEAALASVLSPIAGAAAAVIAGLLSDRLGGRHGRIILPSLALLVADLLLLTLLDLRGRPAIALAFVTAASFFLIGPYTYLAGVISLDLGGKTGSSTASGLCDAAGYVGALVSGFGAGWLAEQYGWQSVFGMLLAVCAITAVIAAGFLLMQERRLARVSQR